MSDVFWEVLLSNGDRVKEDFEDCACWRHLRDRCHKERLYIQEMKYGGQQVHPKADAYFVFFNAIGFVGRETRITKAIGCIYKEKVRLYWYMPGSDNKLMTEAWPINKFEMRNVAEEMLISAK